MAQPKIIEKLDSLERNKLSVTASCNKNWHWNGKGGQPTWLWGGEDGTNMYVYNPANFNVNWAQGATRSKHLETQNANGVGHGTAYPLFCRHNVHGDGRFKLMMDTHETRVDYATKCDYVGGVAVGNLAKQYVGVNGVNIADTNLKQFYGTCVNQNSSAPDTDWWHIINVPHSDNNGYGGQLAIGYHGQQKLMVRSANGTSWGNWYDVIGNIESLKQSVANGKQAVVSAIDNKLGYASGLTINHSGADYAWWIQNKLSTGGVGGVLLMQGSLAGWTQITSESGGGGQFKRTFEVGGKNFTIWLSQWNSSYNYDWYITHVGCNQKFKGIMIQGLIGGLYNGKNEHAPFFTINDMLHNSTGNHTITNFNHIPISTGHGNENGYKVNDTKHFCVMFIP